MKFASLLTTLAVALAAVQEAARALEMPWHETERPGDDLAALCEGRPIELTSYEQLETLEAALESQQLPACATHQEEHVRALARLARASRQDLCSRASIEAYLDFYEFHLDTSRTGAYAASDGRGKINKSLRRFALALGQRTSNLCRKNLLREVLNGELMSPEDRAHMESYVGDGEGPVARVLGPALGGPDEVFLPSDLEPFLRRARARERPLPEKIYLQATTGEHIRALQERCERRLRPVYESLLMPLARLANLGLSYRDHELKARLAADSREARELARWSRIIFLCESLTRIRIVPCEQCNSADGGQMMRILTREEAAAIEGAATAAAAGESALDSSEVIYDAELAGQPVTLPGGGGAIWDKSDAELAKAVRGVKTHRTEQEVIVRRLRKRGLALLSAELSHGHFGVVLSAGLRNLRRKLLRKPVTSPTEALIRKLDEMNLQSGAAEENHHVAEGDHQMGPPAQGEAHNKPAASTKTVSGSVRDTLFTVVVNTVMFILLSALVVASVFSIHAAVI